MSLGATLDNILFTSASGLFKAYGATVSETNSAPGWQPPPLCAVLGFGGTVLTGAMLLAAEPSLLAATRQVPGTSDRDWLAELANQLLGRVKNRLLPYGIEIHASTPIVIRGERIAPVCRDGAQPALFMRSQHGHTATAWLDHTVVDADGVASLARSQVEVPREGDVILF